MPSRTVLSTSCSGTITSAKGIFKAGSVQSDPDGSLPRPAKLFDPEPFRTTDYAFGLKKPRRRQIRQRPASSRARGIVPACPARCLRWSPNVQMPAPSGTRIGAASSAIRGAEVLFRSLLTASLRSTSLPSLRNIRTSSPTSITLIAVTRALFSWRRFSHEGARRSRVAVQVWPWFETPAPNSQHPGQPSPELRPGVWLHGARTSEPFRDRRRLCRDEFLCSRSWHA